MAIDAFSADPTVIGCFSIPSLGYLVGSVGGLTMFLWIANVNRDVSSMNKMN